MCDDNDINANESTHIREVHPKFLLIFPTDRRVDLSGFVPLVDDWNVDLCDDNDINTNESIHIREVHLVPAGVQRDIVRIM